MNIGKSIIVLRKERNLKQGQLAVSIGITQAYLSGIENGKKQPSLEVLENISNFFGTPIPVLFWFGIERTDIPDKKKFVFDALKPSVDKLISEMFTNN